MSRREQYMGGEQRNVLPGTLPRRHDICRARTGVNRPGKTAQERARRAGKN